MEKETLIEQILKMTSELASDMTEQELREKIIEIEKEKSKRKIKKDELYRLLKVKPIIDRAILGTYLDITDSETFCERFKIEKKDLQRYASKAIFDLGIPSDEIDTIDIYISMLVETIRDNDSPLTRMYGQWYPTPENVILSESSKFSVPLRPELVKVYEEQLNRPYSYFLRDLIKILYSTIPGVDAEEILSLKGEQEINQYLDSVVVPGTGSFATYGAERAESMLPKLLKMYIESLDPHKVFNDIDKEKPQEEHRGKHFR